MKARDWAAQRGLAKAGARGKFSNACREALDKAVSEGTKFSDYPKKDMTIVSDKGKPTVVKAVSTPTGEVADVPDETRPEADWRAFVNVDGKTIEIGMRTVCNTCRRSLTYHICDSPRVWVDHDTEAMVNFKPRSTPLPAKRW